MIKSPKLYDRAKWFAQIFLPALGTFYFAVAAIWSLPAAQEVVGTVVALDAFIGVLLGISNKKYLDEGSNFDGDLFINVGQPGDPDIHAAFSEHPDVLKNKNVVTLRTRKVNLDSKPPSKGH